MGPIRKLQNNLPAGTDAALIFSVYNRRYFTGFESSDGILLVTKDAACFLTDFRYIEAARAQVKDCEILMLENQKKQLTELCSRYNVKTACFEAREMPFAEVQALKTSLPEVKFDESNSLSDIIEQLRMIKTADEVEEIVKAQAITDASFKHILEFIKPGVSERDLAIEIEFFMKKSGAKGPSFDLIVVSGENSSLPHGVPGDRKLQKGDFVTIDIGDIVGGYCSDMTRTVALGAVTDEMKKVYDTVLKAQLAALEAVKPGVICSDIDKVARDIIYDAGYTGCFGHGLGHSVGLQIHENPRFSPACSVTTRAGMIMTVEPGIYLAGRFGVRIEDLVLITEDGCRDFTKSPKELIIL